MWKSCLPPEPAPAQTQPKAAGQEQTTRAQPSDTQIHSSWDQQTFPGAVDTLADQSGSEAGQVSVFHGGGGMEECKLRQVGGASNSQHKGCRVVGSLEAVQHFALHAVLDLAPAQHELQHLMDGVLWVLLWEEHRADAGVCPGLKRALLHTRLLASFPLPTPPVY